MQLNLDHWEDLKLSRFSKQELDLLDHARKALKHIELSGYVQKYDQTYYVEGLVHTRAPITLDFRAFRPNDIGQAYFTDKFPLSAELFDGDRFKQSFVDKLTRDFQDFVAHMSKE